MINIFINSLALIILGIIQVSFLTTWPAPVSGLNLILILVIFLTAIISYPKGLWAALGSGLFLELYTSLPFGMTTLSLILTVIFINFLFNNFFTNRSFYSLIILGYLGSIFYHLLILGFNLLGLVFGLSSYFLGFDFWFLFFWQPLLNLLILAIIFFTFYLSTGRLRNIFLFTSDFYEIKK